MPELTRFVWAMPDSSPASSATSMSHASDSTRPRATDAATIASTSTATALPPTISRRPTGRVRRVVAAMLAAVVAAGCERADATPATKDSAASPTPAVPLTAVEVAVVQRDTLATEVAVSGRIEAVQSIAVRPEVDGRIVAIVAREGDAVRAGAPLFRIDDAELRAQVARAEAERDLARQSLQRTRGLLAEQASSRADLERAEALARSAQAQLDLLTVRLARTVVRAPFSGVVGRRLVSLGDYVSPQVALVSLQTTNPQRVSLDVPERYAARLRRGQTVRFGVAAHPGREFTATVEFIDPVVALPARTIVVKALARNADGALQAGMFAEARLATAVRSNALLIPEEALMPAPGGTNSVWVVVDGVSVRRDVTVGVRRAGLVEILEGLSPGEQVVVGGVLQLGDRTPVRATLVASDAAGGAPASTAVR